MLSFYRLTLLNAYNGKRLSKEKNLIFGTQKSTKSATDPTSLNSLCEKNVQTNKLIEPNDLLIRKEVIVEKSWRKISDIEGKKENTPN